jgi:hypothetical protein
MLLEIAKIKATPEAQPRVSLHYPTVEEYAEALRGDAEFPPLVVFFDGKDHWLADGFHRLEAYKQLGYIEVPVDLRKGSKRDAILFSVGANARHGLPRTNEDKRRAVMVLLKDPEWGKKSDRWIAESAAVGKTLVLRLRAEHSGTGLGDQLSGREGKDGKVRKLPERKDAPEPAAPPVGRDDDAHSVADSDDASLSSKRQPTEQKQRNPEPPSVPAAVSPDDPKRGCASLSERDAVDAWVEQGAMLYERFKDGAREYMRTSWDKRLAKLEGY